jgi:RNA polymerase sigma factor (sigma-70 family)
MNDEGSITLLLNSYRQGLSDDSAQQIFQRYFSMLESVARAKVAGLRYHWGDHEDVAQQVMTQFFLGVRDGRFPRLNDRHDLWQVLLVILERRVIDLRRKKRQPVCGESAIGAKAEDASQCQGMQSVPCIEPTPEMVVQLEEELRARLSQLPEGLRQVAVWRMIGHSNAEIARMLGRSERRVESKLSLIRRIWSEAGI